MEPLLDKLDKQDKPDKPDKPNKPRLPHSQLVIKSDSNHSESPSLTSKMEPPLTTPRLASGSTRQMKPLMFSLNVAHSCLLVTLPDSQPKPASKPSHPKMAKPNSSSTMLTLSRPLMPKNGHSTSTLRSQDNLTPSTAEDSQSHHSMPSPESLNSMSLLEKPSDPTLPPELFLNGISSPLTNPSGAHPLTSTSTSPSNLKLILLKLSHVTLVSPKPNAEMSNTTPLLLESHLNLLI